MTVPPHAHAGVRLGRVEVEPDICAIIRCRRSLGRDRTEEEGREEGCDDESGDSGAREQHRQSHGEAPFETNIY